jgi:ABC-2 type transport system permease protein
MHGPSLGDSTVTSDVSSVALREPWRVGGLRSLWTDRRLLWRFTRNLRARRLQGTLLGRTWDYINPLVQFMVYFLVIGVLLGLSRTVENFPLYIFSGLIVVQFFNEGLTGASNSFTRARLLLRRAVFARELVPASHVVSRTIALGPPLAILLVACLALGWRPDLPALLVAVAAMALLAVFTFGLGLIFAVATVFIRDTGQVVGIITTLARWATPVIYPWTLVPERFGDGWITTLYLANPVTIATFGMREAFWHPTVEEGLPPIPTASLGLGIALGVLVLVAGLLVVARYRFRVVQRLRWTT